MVLDEEARGGGRGPWRHAERTRGRSIRDEKERTLILLELYMLSGFGELVLSFFFFLKFGGQNLLFYFI